MKADLVLLWRRVNDTTKLYGLLRTGSRDQSTLVRFWANGTLSRPYMLSETADSRSVGFYRDELLWEKQAKGYRPVAAARFEADTVLADAMATRHRWVSAEAKRLVLDQVGSLLDVDIETYTPSADDEITADPDLVPAFEEGPYGLLYVPGVGGEVRFYKSEVVQWTNMHTGAQVLRLPWRELSLVDSHIADRCGVGDDRDDHDDVFAAADRIYNPRRPGLFRWFRVALADARQLYT